SQSPGSTARQVASGARSSSSASKSPRLQASSPARAGATRVIRPSCRRPPDPGHAGEAFGPGVPLPAAVDGERHGQVLDGEAGGVEDGDLVLVPAPLFLSDENAAELGDVLALEPVVEGMGDLAVVARLLP